MRFYLLPVVFLLLTPLAAWSQEKKIRIVTLGDSITRGSRPGVAAHETFAALLEKGLIDKDHAVEVVNVGIGGERTDQALKRLAKGVIALKPRVVTVMYGTNDSYVDVGKKASRLSVEEYRANLLALVKQLREAGIEAVLMTPPCWGEKARNGLGENPNILLTKFVAACREVAKREKVALVDHYAHWTQAATKGVDVAAWTTDQCHPNPRGHRELAERIVPVVATMLGKLP